MGSFHYQVKNILLKHMIKTQYDVQTLDVDYNEEYLVIMMKNNKRVIEFYELSSILGSSEIVELKTPHFSLRYQTDIYDYFFNKNSTLEHFMYKNFLIVQTADALIIYRESERKIMKKIYSLNISTSSAKEARFKFVFVNPNRTERSIFELIGCFYILQKNTLSFYYIRNLESKQQTIISDTFKMILSHYENNELVSIKSDDPQLTEVCTFAPNFIMAKYIVVSNEGKRTSRLDCFKLLTRSIDSNNFVYNHKNKYIYGNLKHKEMIFAALKNKYEAKFFYKVVLYEREHFFASYWALISKSLFVKININNKQVKLFKILNNQVDVIIVQKKNFDILEEFGDIIMIRFILLTSCHFVTIVENSDSYNIIEFKIENENITSIEPIFTINKAELSKNKITQCEFVQSNKLTDTYKLIIADESNTIKTYLLKRQTQEIILVNENIFRMPILEFYKSKKYPHSLVVLTKDNQLSFFDIDVNYLADFDLSIIGFDIHSNPNNFQLRHLYDSFFIVS